MNSRSYYTRNLLPLLTGICFGLMTYWQIYKIYNNETCDINIAEKLENPDLELQTIKYQKKREDATKSLPKTVKAKPSRFNYDFRPYFVYSELGFKNPVVVAVKTTEERLSTYGIAINNTWSQGFQTVIFFTPYSKNENFHNKYVKKLNLNVIQLPDIVQNSLNVDFSFRILQYLKEHFIHKYSWFIQTTDNIYVNSKNVMNFTQSLNSSSRLFIGKIKKEHGIPACDHRNGLILSRNTMFDLVPQSCSRKENDFGLALSMCLKKNLKIECSESKIMTTWVNNELFITKDHEMPIRKLIKEDSTQEALIISAFSSTEDIFRMHQHFVTVRLNQAFDTIHSLQESIKEFQILIPDGVPEKVLNWPIGYPPSFKPASRFEVIQWNYFDKQHLYGFTDLQPMSSFSTAYYKDFKEILTTIKRAIQHQNYHRLEFDLVNGYHRLDPRRGAEYIIDMKTLNKYTKETKVQRYQLLRPFSKIEPLSMPPATEQKGIHLVLPVLRNDVGHFERFLQMYKRICLQTGENVVLLTVFVNIRNGRFEGDEEVDPFAESKNLIARYKHSYMWAQLPWLQVGVKTYSPVLVMDIVSMKLPSNSLIFLVSHDTDFTINFMNRCRVNVIGGVQVFFPIPFMEYDPDLVYAGKQKPAFAEVHKTTGTWNREITHVACFCNKDYKEIRMWRPDFLVEQKKENETILGVFQASKLHVFRAIEAELRTRFSQQKCLSSFSEDERKHCIVKNARQLGNRAQLAQVLFEKGYTP